MNSMKRQKDRIQKDELLRSVGAPYATGNQWRNNSRKKEEIKSKHKYDSQLLMFLGVKVMSNTIKNNIA